MTRVLPSTRRAAFGAKLLLTSLLAVGSGAACSGLLDVSDPTAVVEGDLDNPQGAEMLRVAVYQRLNEFITVYPAFFSGLTADEFRIDLKYSYFLPYQQLDRRLTGTSAETYYDDFVYPNWQDLWGIRTVTAIEKLRSFALPGAREAHMGEMYAIRGYAATMMAEHYCSGFPLHDVEHFTVVTRPPVTMTAALERAVLVYDSAKIWGVDSARVMNIALAGRARALLDLGRFEEAAADVAAVPTNFLFQEEYAGGALWDSESMSISDREGGNGIDFVSANDPRLPTSLVGTATDGSGNYFPNAPGKHVWFLSGIEARLIEAEAALHATSPTWLTTLNALRTDGTQTAGVYNAGSGGVAGLAPLTDPGTPDSRLDLVYRERAFWLFGTGTRLGDLRRLVRVYGRDPNLTFPAGAYWGGGSYGTAMSMAFGESEAKASPGVTGCTAW